MITDPAAAGGRRRKRDRKVFSALDMLSKAACEAYKEDIVRVCIGGIVLRRGASARVDDTMILAGEGCIIRGARNMVRGCGVTVLGDQNRVKGTRMFVLGEWCSVHANNSEVVGDANFVRGNNNFVTGRSVTVLGDDNGVTGDNAVVTGDNNQVCGRGAMIMDKSFHLLARSASIAVRRAKEQEKRLASISSVSDSLRERAAQMIRDGPRRPPRLYLPTWKRRSPPHTPPAANPAMTSVAPANLIPSDAIALSPALNS